MVVVKKIFLFEGQLETFFTIPTSPLPAPSPNNIIKGATKLDTSKYYFYTFMTAILAYGIRQVIFEFNVACRL